MDYRNIVYYPPPIGDGVCVFNLFIYLFLCQQDYEKTTGPICMKFSGKVWTVEWPWDDLIQFWVNSGKWVGGSKVNLLSPDIDSYLVWLLSSSSPVLPSSDWECNKIAVLAYCYIATRDGVCCALHHSLFYLKILPVGSWSRARVSVAEPRQHDVFPSKWNTDQNKCRIPSKLTLHQLYHVHLTHSTAL